MAGDADCRPICAMMAKERSLRWVPTIANYVLVELSEPLVHVYSRGASGDFIIRPEEIRRLNGTVALPVIRLSMAMAAIYEGMDFSSEITAETPSSSRRP